MDSCEYMEAFEMVERQTNEGEKKSYAFNGQHTLQWDVMSKKNSVVMNSQEHTYYNFIILMTFY